MRSIGSIVLLGLVLACSDSDTPTAPQPAATQPGESPGIQAAALAKESPILRVSTTNKVTSPQLTHFYSAANCPEGTVAIGGGVRFKNIDGTSSFNYVSIAAFGPNDNNGYFIWYRLTQATQHQVIVTALCLRLSA